MAIIVSIMEILELRYFLSAAQFENMHRASESLGVSVGSISKAVRRLEEELQVKLFSRSGRNVKLTDVGLSLQQKAAQLVAIEKGIKQDLTGGKNHSRLLIGGEESALNLCFESLSDKLSIYSSHLKVDFRVFEKKHLFKAVDLGEVDVGLTSANIPKKYDSKIFQKVKFSTFCSSSHPLFRKFKSKSVSISEILQWDFVVPSHSLYGGLSWQESSDGWREDKFPRQITYLVESLALGLRIAEQGKALIYCPTELGIGRGLRPLEIAQCPFTCRQTLKIFAKDRYVSGVVNHLF